MRISQTSLIGSVRLAQISWVGVSKLCLESVVVNVYDVKSLGIVGRAFLFKAGDLL